VHETRGTGPVYQGRFKALPIETNRHFITVCRYVERNAVRAGLVTRARDWPWSR
jgi:putative transposase